MPTWTARRLQRQRERRENMKEEEEEGNQQAEKKVGLHTRTPLARTLPKRPTWASKAP